MLIEERRISRREFTEEKNDLKKKKRNFKQGVAFTIGSDKLGLNLGSSPELLEESPLLPSQGILQTIRNKLQDFFLHCLS